ncbi:hypothetical protein Pan181_31980 [Aeoliella mucimassa]|uniref:Uncharacterized protein n=1 Tax=Aeoliella mucimassa TaxID=2527972 RepID=A0A518AQJ1_9BACT|nr:hypothetical protein Pan181_31980 [Aeoliella mucimassa]
MSLYVREEKSGNAKQQSSLDRQFTGVLCG